MTYQESLDYIFSRTKSFQQKGAEAFNPSLANTIALCEKLGNPQNKFKSIHVGGTNGKGSTSAILNSAFIENGYKVGSFTSPHYLNFTERIRVNGKEISEDGVIEFIELIQPEIESLQLSFFEITFCMAMWYFAQQKVELAVVEVGLGGRLDSTNILNPICSVITNIGFDHQEFLGDTLQQIATEKAGIIKENTPVIIGESQQETKAVFVKTAQQNSAPIVFADEAYKAEFSSFDLTKEGREFTLKNEEETFTSTTDLVADYQLNNIRTAYTAIQQVKNELQISEKAIKNGISNVTKNTGFFGRFQLLNTSPLVVADSAHNAEGVAALMQQVKQLDAKQIHFIYGCVSDKDVSKIVEHFPENIQLYITEPSVPRKMPVNKLAQQLNNKNIAFKQSYPSVDLAYTDVLKRAQKEDCIIVFGSIYLIADLLEIL